MKRLFILSLLLVPTLAFGQTEPGPYARIAILRPHDGKTTEFESGYIRHLNWHKEAGDPWAWYGWSVWAGDRQRWFVYATFGHSANDFDRPVAAAEDEKDNIVNVVPHATFVGNGLYEFLPKISRGNSTGIPQPAARVEYTTIEVKPGEGTAFENAIATGQQIEGEVIWYRMIAGGDAPRYVRIRTFPGPAAIINSSKDSSLPDAVKNLTIKVTVEILALRPNMSYNLKK